MCVACPAYAAEGSGVPTLCSFGWIFIEIYKFNCQCSRSEPYSKRDSSRKTKKLPSDEKKCLKPNK